MDWTTHFIKPKPGATETDLKVLETALGFPVPTELRSLLSAVGGGVFEPHLLVRDDGWEYGFHTLVGGTKEIQSAYQRFVGEKKLIAPEHIPFARNAGGDIYTVHRNSGAVWFWPMDGEATPQEVIGSIEQLLQELQSDEEDEAE